MTKNKLLNIAITLCKISRIFFIILFVGFTSVFIHLQIDKEFYSATEFHIKMDTSDFNFVTKSKHSTDEDYKDIFIIDKIKIWSLYGMYLKYVGVLIILFLSVKEFQKIMESVKETKTFRENNVASFRRIGQLIFVYTVLTSFTAISFENGSWRGVSLSFIPPSFILLAFIMAEIFKEGTLLREENDLTI